MLKTKTTRLTHSVRKNRRGSIHHWDLQLSRKDPLLMLKIVAGKPSEPFGGLFLKTYGNGIAAAVAFWAWHFSIGFHDGNFAPGQEYTYGLFLSKRIKAAYFPQRYPL